MARKGPTFKENLDQFYYKQLLRQVTNLFKWENMPDDIQTDYIENTLIKEGNALFFYDAETIGYSVLRTTPYDTNIYDKPVSARCDVASSIPLKKYSYERTIYYGDGPKNINKQGILINNMYNSEPLVCTIKHYARRLAMLQRAYDTNILWQNIPVIFYTENDTVRLSVEKMFDNIEKGIPLVIQDKLLFKDRLPEPTPTQVEFVLDKLADAKLTVMDEFKTQIGINSIPVEKKERLVTDEVNSNNEQVETCLQIMLSQREKASKLINELFNLNTSVAVNKGGDSYNGDNNNGAKTSNRSRFFPI